MTNHEPSERGPATGLHTDDRKDGSQLVATLAHELRNPLASILTGLYVMRHSGANEAAAQLARDRVERQARHVARIIDGVLDVCRAGRDARPQPVAGQSAPTVPRPSNSLAPLTNTGVPPTPVASPGT